METKGKRIGMGDSKSEFREKINSNLIELSALLKEIRFAMKVLDDGKEGDRLADIARELEAIRLEKYDKNVRRLKEVRRVEDLKKKEVKKEKKKSDKAELARKSERWM